MSIAEKLLKLEKQLFPTGRAFRVPAGGIKERLLTAVNLTFGRADTAARGVLDSILPDNDNFTEEDATRWERRLALTTATGTTLADRKLAIKRKMNHPGTIKARQNWRYVQGQLQAAGFDLYVYENRFDDGGGHWETQDPFSIWSGGTEERQHGQFEHGQAQHGSMIADFVVNSLDNETDQKFMIGANARSLFFIGGSTIGTYGSVPSARRVELRQLILRLKPVQTGAILFINYT